MEIPLPTSLPQPHREFLNRAVETLSRERWLVGIAANGSFTTNAMDAYSDLDLLLVVEDDQHGAVMANRTSIAASLGTLLTSFTGEHLGQPHLLMCLYGAPLLHADITFETLTNTAKRTGDFIVLWERDTRLTSVLPRGTAAYPELDAQWIEDRFWVWVHKACGKVGRGELFHALEYLVFLRSKVLGPLILFAAGQPPLGVKRLELDAPALAADMKATAAGHNAAECLAALRACVELYHRLRPAEGPVLVYRRAAEDAVTDYLAEMEQKSSATHPAAGNKTFDADRLAQQMRFLVEVDKVKQIFRRNRILDGSRYENDAEHSWTVALTAMTLAEYSAEPADVPRVIKMLLIHDIVEIDAGDTFPYGHAGVDTQHERESLAADRIFNLLPAGLAAEYRGLWDEFETKETPEARFATSIDHLGSVIPHYHNDGGAWRDNDISVEQVVARNIRIEPGSPVLWDYARGLIEELAAKGVIKRG